MAEIQYSISRVGESHRLVTWTGVTQADTFQSFLNAKNIKSAVIQIAGTFGAATVVVNGSNDNTVFAGLSDHGATAISVTVNSIKFIQERPLYFQPAASGGTGQSLTVKLLLRL